MRYFIGSGDMKGQVWVLREDRYERCIYGEVNDWHDPIVIHDHTLEQMAENFDWKYLIAHYLKAYSMASEKVTKVV